MYRAVTSLNQRLIKFLKFFTLVSANYYFLLCIMASFFYEKVFFYILTAFSSFTENVSINFEPKNFKSLIMLLSCVRSSRPKPFQGVQQENFS